MKPEVLTQVPGVLWPAVPTGTGAAMLALQWQLRRSQWWTEAQARRAQLTQLRRLISHAVGRVPFYAGHLRKVGIPSVEDITPEVYAQWPILSSRDVREAHSALLSSASPPAHGPSREQFTTGSTGVPKRIVGTEVALLMQAALVMRDHLWQKRDFAKKFAAIRFFAKEATHASWSPLTGAAFRTGPSVLLGVNTDVASQMRWLIRQAPAYLLTTPSNLGALVRHGMKTGERPQSLLQVMTYSEVLPDDLRTTVYQAWNVPLSDSYSCTEAGALALQCPDQGGYHVQSEATYLEILRDDGTSCRAGEVGRVVITPLHNFAMPLLRYELGDYAEVGPPCACGRGLPVIRRIVGRVRNMARDPLGRVFQPGLDLVLKEAALPIDQFQFVQLSLETVEMSYVMARELSEAERQRLQDAVRRHLLYPFEMRFRRVDAIPRSAGGKYEGFVSRLEDEP